MPPMLRRLLIVFVGVLVVLTLASVWLARGVPVADGQDAQSDAPVPIGGAFMLTDQNGKQVTDADFKGKLMVVFFGFTHCPDICPTTLGTLTTVMQDLGEAAKDVQPILITVDPARDTPEVVKEYLKAFHPSVVGLTGSKEQIESAVAAYRVYAAKQEVPQESDPHAGMDHGDGNYLVNHSGFIYLMGRDGKYLTHFSQDDTPAKITAAIRGRL